MKEKKKKWKEEEINGFLKVALKKYLCLWTIAARADASGECFAFTVNALSSRARRSVHLKKSEWDIKWASRRGSEKWHEIPLQRCFCHSSRQRKELPVYTCPWSRHPRDRWCRSSVVELGKDKAIDTNLSTTKIRIESHVQKKGESIKNDTLGTFPIGQNGLVPVQDTVSVQGFVLHG